jgi:hypothetical protein
MSLKLLGFSQDVSLDSLDQATSFLSFVDMNTGKAVRIRASQETIADLTVYSVENAGKSSLKEFSEQVKTEVESLPRISPAPVPKSHLPSGFFNQEEVGATPLDEVDDPDDADFDEEGNPLTGPSSL